MNKDKLESEWHRLEARRQRLVSKGKFVAAERVLAQQNKIIQQLWKD